MDLQHLLSLYIAELEAQEGRDRSPDQNAGLSAELNRFFQFVEKAQTKSLDANQDFSGTIGDRTTFYEAGQSSNPSASSDSQQPSTAELKSFSPSQSSEIGNYKLIQKIAEGGMGAVWLAEQQQPVRRRVALKLIKAGRDNDQIIARFDAERQALAMMEHPHIAKMLDAGQTEDGLPFFVMELVQGLPITLYCDRNRLSLLERLRLFIPVCQAIQHAHQKGIIHRDLKPSNVLVSHQDSQPAAKVIDFGLAKAVQHQTRLTDKTMFTEYGQVVGTLQYMSPEQAELNSIDIDTRTDIYSLGVLLYELLTGSTPLQQKSLANVSIFQVLEHIRTQEPPRPSARLSECQETLVEIGERRRIVPDKLRDVLRGDLDWVVMKALDKDRTRRYETASALAEDIQRYIQREPIVARPPSAIYITRKFIAKYKVAVIGSACILALLVLGLAGTALGLSRALVAQSREAAARGVAEANLRRAQQAETAERQRSEQLKARSEELEKQTDFQRTQIQSIDATQIGRDIRTALMRDYAQLHQARNDGDSGLGVEPAELQQALQRLNFTDIATEGLRTSIFVASLNTIKKQYADQPIFQAKLLLTLSRTMRSKGIYDPAPVEECMAICQRQFGEHAAETFEAKLEYAHLLRDQGKLEESRQLDEEILERCRQVLGNEHQVTHDAISTLAGTLVDLGSFTAAEELYREVIKLRLAIDPADSPDVLNAKSGLARALWIQEEEAKRIESEELKRELVSKRLAIHGPMSEEVLMAKMNLAVTLYDREKYDESLKLDEEVVSGFKELLGELHPRTLVAVNNLAASYFALNKHDQALALYQDLLSKLRDTLGEDHPHTLLAAKNTARSLKELGKFAESKSLFMDTISKQRRIYGDGHPWLLKSIYMLGAMHFGLEEFEQATPWLNEYVQATYEHTTGCILIRCLLKQNRQAEAIAIRDQLRDHLHATQPDLNVQANQLGEMAQEFWLRNANEAAKPLLIEARRLFQQTNDRTSDGAVDVETMLEDISQQPTAPP